MSMDFNERLEKAIQRGHRLSDQRAQAAAREALSEEELRRMHSQFRLELSEHIEQCLRRLPDHFPGFRFETLVGERGWGAVVSRNDLRILPEGRKDFFSRLEMTVRPFSSYHVLELVARGAVANKEAFSRSQFQKLVEADIKTFRELVDVWVLEYAEQYAAHR